MIPVNEVFETIQGEAWWTGAPSIFMRLQGCAVGCPWCDTKHTWVADDRNRVLLSEVLVKSKDSSLWAASSARELVKLAGSMRSRHVVITGGEPCAYDLHELTAGLEAIDKTVQIETSGTSPIRATSTTWVTLSPKIDMPGGLALRDDALVRADEIKMPIGKRLDAVKLMEVLARRRALVEGGDVYVWLQPLSQNEKATDICMSLARENGWRVSVQVHKYLGVR